MKNTFLALDYGAGSGRAELVTLENGRLTAEEIHRFPNQPIRLGDTLYWDFPFLFDDMEESMLDLVRRFQQPLPDCRGELIRCVLESLALEVAYRLELLCSLSRAAAKLTKECLE